MEFSYLNDKYPKAPSPKLLKCTSIPNTVSLFQPPRKTGYNMPSVYDKVS